MLRTRRSRVILALAAVGAFLLWWFLLDASTRYVGTVQVEALSADELEARLRDRGCASYNSCTFERAGDAIRVEPWGCMGDCSVTITPGLLRAEVSARGMPLPGRFAEQFRNNLTNLGLPVAIVEDSWDIESWRYPSFRIN